MKTRNILCAFLTLIAVGCVKEQPAGNEDNTPATGGRTIEVNMPEMTRTALGDETTTGVSLVWSKGDEIAVIEGKGTEAQKYSIYRLVGEGGTASGTFEYVSGDAVAEVITDVVFPASAVENNYAVPTSQTYVEGSFDTDAMVMSYTRTSDDEAITLKHEAAALMVRLTGTAQQEISSVSVKIGTTTYKLTCSAPVALSSEEKAFYVAVPGSEDARAFTVSVTPSNGTAMKRAVNTTLAAGKIGRLPVTAFPAVEHSLSVGDYFGGGMVFNITADYVKVVSVDEESLAWATGDATTALAGVTANNPEGNINTAILVQNGIENYPAAEWCVNHGEGWYMPSRTEIAEIVNGLDISTETMSDASARFIECGGNALSTARYYTSTEAKDGENVWTVSIPAIGTQTADGNRKTAERPVRAVKKIMLTGGETADPKPTQTTRLTPTADAFYSNSNSTYYRGLLDNIYIYYSESGDLRRAGYFKLDISTLDPAKLTSAVLNLSVYTSMCDFYDFETLEYRAYKVSNDWEELDYTTDLGKKAGVWTNDLSSVCKITISSTATSLSFDLTDCIVAARQNNEDVISVCIQSPNTNYKKVDGKKISAKLYVYSKESTEEGTQPYLQVTTLK